MNTRILLLALGMAALSSCSSVYKSGQTPDDVYYSPAPVRQGADSYVEVNQQKPGTSYQSYEQYQENLREDRFLRLSMHHPYYMSMYDMYSGFDWHYNSFYNDFSYGFGSPWNNYFAWNSFYNPYCSPYYSNYMFMPYYGYGSYYYGGGYYAGNSIKYGSYAPISKPRVFNVNNYSNGRSSSRVYMNNGSYYNTQRYNNSNNNYNNNNRYYNNNTNNGRSMYTPSNSDANNSYTPSRSYSPSSSGGSSGGSVSRPGRGN